jgi:hypothetical protein
MANLVPTFIMRAGFNVASHGELAQNYIHWQLSDAFHFREIAAGAVEPTDVMAVDYTRQIADIFQRMQTGQATFILDNARGAYSPASRAQFVPGMTVCLKGMRTDPTSGDPAFKVQGMFSGVITGYQINPAIGISTAQITAEDRATLLRRKVNMPMRINTKTASLAIDLMTATGIATGDHDIDPNAADDITFSLIDDMTAGEALDRLIKSGAHSAWVDAANRITFKDRLFEFRSATPVAEFDEFESFGYDLPWDRVINDVRVTSAPRIVATLPQTVGFLTEAPVVPGSGGILEFFVGFQDVLTNEQGVPVTSVSAPVATTDWLLNSQPDGAGTNLTGAAQLSFTPFARSALVQVVNNAGQNGFLTKLNVRGIPIKEVPAYSTLSQDSASIAKFERRAFEIETELISTIAFSQAYGDLLLDKRRDATPTINISVRNQWPETLFLEIGQRILVSEDITGINTAWTIRGMEHQISMDPGMSHTATYALETADSRKYLVLDRDPEGTIDADRVLAP